MMKKFLSIIGLVALTTLFGANINAANLKKDSGKDLITQSKAFSIFEKIEANNNFNITFVNSDTYSAEWTVNKDLQKYIEIYTRKKTLYLTINKVGRRYISRYYSGRKNPKPVLNVSISLPTISEIELNDNVTIDKNSQPINSNDLTIKMYDYANIGLLNVRGNDDAKVNITLKGKSDAALNINVKEVEVNMKNHAHLALTGDNRDVTVNTRGAAKFESNGNLDNITINAKGSSKLILVGTANDLNLKSKSFASIDCNEFQVKNADVFLNSNEAWIYATDRLIIDIRRGAKLVYSGEPAIDIKSITRSTVHRYNDKNRRK